MRLRYTLALILYWHSHCNCFLSVLLNTILSLESMLEEILAPMIAKIVILACKFILASN